MVKATSCVTIQLRALVGELDLLAKQIVAHPNMRTLPIG